MKPKQLKKLLGIIALILATGAAIAHSSDTAGRFWNRRISPAQGVGGVLAVSAHLIQNKILLESAGTVGFSLTLQALETAEHPARQERNVDIVVVLDRSGSMKGRKINGARRAVLNLIENLSPNDRFALITYSDGVRIDATLRSVTGENRRNMVSAVYAVTAGGGTNLGAGLQVGINILSSAQRSLNTARVILISDGLANRGITDVRTLGAMAATAVKNEFTVSTVGVGADFNEQLMTAIADRGTGYYYYMENPSTFAEVFRKEFYNARAAAVTGLVVEIPKKSGITLVDAAGYPITFQNDKAVFFPGSLRSGQNRRLFLTLQVPSGRLKTYILDGITVGYRFNGRAGKIVLKQAFAISCVDDQGRVYSSIDRMRWSQKVIHEDLNRLKQEVAADIKAGKKQRALKKVEAYRHEQQAVNAVVGSDRVSEILDNDLKELKEFVEKTFQGTPQVVQQQQKSNAKALQYEGYSGRRQ